MLEFKNTYSSTRNGFRHLSELFLDGKSISIGLCRYMNRTWENYAFQSSMKQAISNAIENEVNDQKNKRDIKRLTAKAKEQIENESELIQLLKTKYKSL